MAEAGLRSLPSADLAARSVLPVPPPHSLSSSSAAVGVLAGDGAQGDEGGEGPESLERSDSVGCR